MDISEEYQAELFPYAYRILGRIDDARDVIQDVIANHIESNPDNIKNKSAAPSPEMSRVALWIRKV